MIAPCFCPLARCLPALLALSLVACGSKKQSLAPPGAPPAPETVSKETPGGNAADPHQAALTRLMETHIGWRSDKDKQARFPHPDQRHWTRVRFFTIKHFVGFKYGDDNHAISVGFIVPLPPDAPRTSAACVEQFEVNSMPQVADFGGTVTDLKTEIDSWQEQVLMVRKAVGEVSFLGKHYEAALSWAGFPAYEGACMVYAYVVPFDGHRELAYEVRDRLTTGYKKFRPMTVEIPYRR